MTDTTEPAAPEPMELGEPPPLLPRPDMAQQQAKRIMGECLVEIGSGPAERETESTERQSKPEPREPPGKAPCPRLLRMAVLHGAAPSADKTEVDALRSTALRHSVGLAPTNEKWMSLAYRARGSITVTTLLASLSSNKHWSAVFQRVGPAPKPSIKQTSGTTRAGLAQVIW